jgi:ribosomal-protein-alanine N-acetyltransferase
MSGLRTPRLSLEPFVLADADALFSIRGDSLAMAHWDWPGDTDIEQAKAVAHTLVEDMRRGVSIYWTVRLSGGEFVGVVDLSELSANRAELGFMLRRDRWGHGYGAEAAGAAIAQAWSLGLASLTARIHAGNLRSMSLLGRLGFLEVAARAVEIRPDVTRQCHFFELNRPSS